MNKKQLMLLVFLGVLVIIIIFVVSQWNTLNNVKKSIIIDTNLKVEKDGNITENNAIETIQKTTNESNENKLNTAASTKIKTERQFQKELQLEEIISKFAKLFELDINESSINFENEFGGKKCKVAILTTQSTKLVIDLERDTVLLFAFSEPKVPPELTQEDRIDERTAIDSMNSILDRLDIAEQFKQDELRYIDLINGYETLHGAFWGANKKFKNYGIPVFGQGVKIEVSAYTGKVVSFLHWPRSVKSSEKSDVSDVDIIPEELGIDIAMEYLEDILIDDPIPTEHVSKLVYLSSSLEQAFINFPNQNRQTKLTWAVAFKGKDTAPISIFIDSYTGEVIGALGVR